MIWTMFLNCKKNIGTQKNKRCNMAEGRFGMRSYDIFYVFADVYCNAFDFAKNLQLSHQVSIYLGGPTSEFFWLPHGHMVSPKAFKS